MNNVCISGKVGQEPKVSMTQSGKAKTRLSIAVYVGKEIENEWFTVEAWNWLAEKLSKAKIGDTVFIEGRNRAKKYTDKDGNIKTDRYIQAMDGGIEPKKEKMNENLVPQYEMTYDDEEMPF